MSVEGCTDDCLCFPCGQGRLACWPAGCGREQPRWSCCSSRSRWQQPPDAAGRGASDSGRTGPSSSGLCAAVGHHASSRPDVNRVRCQSTTSIVLQARWPHLDLWSVDQSRQACVLCVVLRRVMKAAAERLSAASMLKKLNQGGVRWDHTMCTDDRVKRHALLLFCLRDLDVENLTELCCTILSLLLTSCRSQAGKPGARKRKLGGPAGGSGSMDVLPSNLIMSTGFKPPKVRHLG